MYIGSGASDTVVSAAWHKVGQVAGVGVFPPTLAQPQYRLVFTLNGVSVYERDLGTSVNFAKLSFAIGVLGTGVELRVNHGHHVCRYAPANSLPGASTRSDMGLGLPVTPFLNDVPMVKPHDKGTGRVSPGPIAASEVATLRAQLAAAERTSRPLTASAYPSMTDAELDSTIATLEAALAAVRKEKSGRIGGLVAAVASNASVRSACTAHGVAVMNVAWEDTGRFKGSCFGPNISDMTLSAQGRDMPIIRMPNFSDLTSDHDIDTFYLVVGNEKPELAGPAGLGAGMCAPFKYSVTLKDYLMDIAEYTGNVRIQSLYHAARDSKVVVGTQACILPLRDGKVEFNVKLYNYQSQSEPAVLVIVASSEGTSAQVVMGRANSLRFNKHGQAADFVAERLSDDRVKRGVAVEGAMSAEEKSRNSLLIIQVPLKVSAPSPSFWGGDLLGMSDGMAVPCAPCSVGGGGAAFAASVSPSSTASIRYRGIEAAMLSTGEAKGPFEGTKGLKMERDPTMPIRVTIQHYHVTDTADIPASSIEAIAAQVKELYDAAAPWNRGSLVTEGETGRSTEMVGRAKHAPPPRSHYWGFYVPPPVIPVPVPVAVPTIRNLPIVCD